MTDQHRPEEWAALGAAWRSDAAVRGAFEAVDVDEVRARAAAFARKIRHRNARELIGCAIVVVAGVSMAIRESAPLMVAGSVAMVAGAIFVAGVLMLRGRNDAPPPHDRPTREVLAHERHELERQARLLERVWLWYLAPLLPCVVLIYADRLLRAIEGGNPGAIATIVAMFVASVLLFVGVGWLNARGARRLRARLSALVDQDS